MNGFGIPQVNADAVQDRLRADSVLQAAAELAYRLETLAGALAVREKPERVRYGRGRLRHSRKRHSPAGFVLDPANLQILLLDGRLWTYSRTDSARFPTGRYYDARADFASFVGNRASPGGREFVFLGAVVGKYAFGYAGNYQGHDSDDSGRHRSHAGPVRVEPAGLYALCGEGSAVGCITADEAFAAIASLRAANGTNGT